MATQQDSRDTPYTDFAEVFKQEIEGWVALAARRRPGPDRKPIKGEPHQSNELVGLALSGGGIRSATFALGACQALARYRVLLKVDYLSTVSGGAYFGAALSTLLHWRSRKPSAGPSLKGHPMDEKNFPFSFDPTGPDGQTVLWKAESPPVRHLREQSNYLAPRLGLFDTQTWYTISKVVMLWLSTLLFLILPPFICFLSLLTFVDKDVWNRIEPLEPKVVPGISTTGFSLPSVVGIPLAIVVCCFLIFLVTTVLPRAPQPQVFSVIHKSLLFAILGSLLGLAFIFSVKAALGFQEWAIGTFGVGFAGFLAAGRWAFARLGELGKAQETLGKVGIGHWISTVLPQVLFAVLGYLTLFGGMLVLFIILDGDLGTNVTEGQRKYLAVGFGAATVALLVWPVQSVVWLLNVSSLHTFYKGRLSDSYIQKPVGEGVKAGPDADVPLYKLGIQEDGSRYPVGPYHLIGTALNIAGGTDIHLLSRKSDAFFLSPLYSGSSITGFVKTENLDHGLTVGTAMAISGAAFSPNQGSATHASMAILLTLLNARLGYWLRNPRAHFTGTLGGVLILPLFFFKEMFGKASGNDPYVYLSDGGHFDNLGVYELIRRRCRYIIAVDGSGEPSDKDAHFGTIGTVSRLVRIDFGVDIQMDLSDLVPDKETGRTRSHCALGRIIYPKERDDQTQEEREGLLVYLKATLLGEENAPDLEYYDRISPIFPNHSTADQFFDEAQFESYRALGYHIARDVFVAGLAGKVTEEQKQGPQKEHWLMLDRLCERWDREVMGLPAIR